MEYLYVLKLEQGKWYVGKSANVINRYEQHRSKKGAAWTSKFTPEGLVECRLITSEHDETNTTKDYMKKYGIENVRGGAYTQIDIPSATISVLQHEILGNTDKCYNCGLPGHFTNNCKKQTLKKEIVKEEYEYECDYCDRTFTTQFGCSVHEKSCQKTAVPECFRCGRAGHFKQDCYARTHVNGYSL